MINEFKNIRSSNRNCSSIWYAGIVGLDTATPVSAVQHLGNATTAGNVTAGGNMTTGDNTTLTG
jgi:hypothetical protein